MLRILNRGDMLPLSLPVSPAATFQPGNIAQFIILGNQQLVGVSDGQAPLGIIDDVKTSTFTSVSWDEAVITPIITATQIIGGKVCTLYDTTVLLLNPNVDSTSFISLDVDCELKPRNGVVIFPAGTALNFDQAGSGTPDSIRTIVRYSYQVPNTPGDDSTAATNRVTVWVGRLWAETDIFETNQNYPVNANLFVNETGQLTTRQLTANQPAVAMVTAPPGPMYSALQFLWW